MLFFQLSDGASSGTPLRAELLGGFLQIRVLVQQLLLALLQLQHILETLLQLHIAFIDLDDTMCIGDNGFIDDGNLWQLHLILHSFHVFPQLDDLVPLCRQH